MSLFNFCNEKRNSAIIITDEPSKKLK